MAKYINPGGAAPIAPYTPGVWVEASQTLYLSGQLGFLEDGKTLAPDVVSQTRRACQRMEEVLREAGQGLTMENVVSNVVLLADMNDYAAMNAEYAKHFPAGKAPARMCYAVKALPLGAAVEIQGVAVKFHK